MPTISTQYSQAGIICSITYLMLSRVDFEILRCWDIKTKLLHASMYFTCLTQDYPFLLSLSKAEISVHNSLVPDAGDGLRRLALLAATT